MTISVDKQVVRYQNGSFDFQKPKSKSGIRTISMGESAIEVLRVHREKVWDMQKKAGDSWVDYDLIFPTKKGTPVQACNVRRSFRRLVKESGLPKDQIPDNRDHIPST